MKKELDSNLGEEDILICINTLRDVLNEMCCTTDEVGQNSERLKISRQMDQLIVDYMGLRNKHKEGKEILTTHHLGR